MGIEAFPDHAIWWGKGENGNRAFPRPRHLVEGKCEMIATSQASLVGDETYVHEKIYVYSPGIYLANICKTQ